jgi:lysozyme family protein
MADFNQAFKVILKHEGGFQKLTTDKGNWTGGKIGVGELKGTKYGISAAQFPDLDIENLTIENAGAIYQSKYWFYDGLDSQTVANKLADLGVLFGTHVVIAVAQTTLQAVDPEQPVTGNFGLITQAHLNQVGEASFLRSFTGNMVTHCFNVVTAHPEDRIFLKNWTNRINCADETPCEKCAA